MPEPKSLDADGATGPNGDGNSSLRRGDDDYIAKDIVVHRSNKSRQHDIDDNTTQASQTSLQIRRARLIFNEFNTASGLAWFMGPDQRPDQEQVQ